jgi:hypothetical protein
VRHLLRVLLLLGTLAFTVEAADWDSRAALAGLPRTLPESDATRGSQSGAAGSGSPKKQRSSLQLSRTAAAEAAGASLDAPGSPKAQQQQLDGASKGTSLNRSDSSLSNRSEGATSTAAATAAGSALSSSSSGSGATCKTTLGGDASAAVRSSVAAQQRQPAGVLDLAVKAFDTRK